MASLTLSLCSSLTHINNLLNIANSRAVLYNLYNKFIFHSIIAIEKQYYGHIKQESD